MTSPAVRSKHDDDISFLVTLVDVPVRIDHLLERVVAVDDRQEFPRSGDFRELVQGAFER